ncbi:hypothetical protein [Candidatus Nitrososphaera gargensis]|uniref:hypothetical protein n=1 Tax=Candidatus Nitrososphaera gargensis TaxID=497727 RepID=UPI0011E542A5|nr:hypothetical protein [Candidatus Nitrososphaera gargensis]
MPSITNYSTPSLCRRIINSLDIKINERVGNDIVIALDSTGIKVANRAERMDAAQQVACTQRLPEEDTHVCGSCDIRKKKVVSLQVTSEEVQHDDGKVLKKRHC